MSTIAIKNSAFRRGAQELTKPVNGAISPFLDYSHVRGFETTQANEYERFSKESESRLMLVKANLLML